MPQLDDAVAIFVGTAGTAPYDELLRVPGWEPDDWKTLFAHAKAIPIAAGSVLIQKDEAKRTLYFVTSGLLEVTAILSSHSLAPIAKIKAGSIVGELAFLDGKPRSAKVWAVVHSTLYALEYEDYQRFKSAHPGLACELIFGIGRLVANRLRRTLSSAGL
jgi:CRP/FNR family transcriptional regulator, cyclic AMP receptor protein